MRLVKINRELTAGGKAGRGPRDREAGLHQEWGQREADGVAMSSTPTQLCILLF